MSQGLRIALSAVFMLGALLVVHLRSPGEAIPIRKPLDSFPGSIAAWQQREGTAFDSRLLNILRPTDYLMRRYQTPNGSSVWLFIGYWDSQRRGAQIHSPKNCLPGAGWEPLQASSVTLRVPGVVPAIAINRYLIQKDREQQLVLYWYHSRGRATAGELAARIEMMKGSLVDGRTDGALIRISAAVQGSAAETSERLVQFVQSMYPMLGEYLPD